MKSIHIKSLAASLVICAAAMILTSCHRDKFYTCQCQTGNQPSTHVIGRTSSENAYAQCKQYQDSMTTCNMWVQK